MKLLIVDDEDLSRDILAMCLEDFFGFEVTQAESAEKALEIYKREPYPLVITDIKMPGMNGIDLLKNIKSLPYSKSTEVILFTGNADVDSAVQALKNGAYDYLMKPVQVNELKSLIQKYIEEQKQKEDFEKIGPVTTKEIFHGNESLENNHEKHLTIEGVFDVLIYSKKVKSDVAIALKYHDEPDIPVLIEGESGTGKEIFTNIIHHGTKLSERPLVSLNCSAISPSLFESELFGYEGGTFTGAKSSGMKGKLELAEGGTLFLDEIGEMPLDLQPKLLRVLQERTFYRVGGLKSINLNVRIVAATNRDLAALVESGSFRRDLYHRLKLGWLSLQPLREQKESIPKLALEFLFEISNKRKKKFRIITKEAAAILKEYPWPGNVRELKNAMERIVIHYDDIELNPEHLAILSLDHKINIDPALPVIRPGRFAIPEEGLNLLEHEAEIIDKALEKFNGNKSKAAVYLGITRSALRSRMK